MSRAELTRPTSVPPTPTRPQAALQTPIRVSVQTAIQSSGLVTVPGEGVATEGPRLASAAASQKAGPALCSPLALALQSQRRLLSVWPSICEYSACPSGGQPWHWTWPQAENDPVGGRPWLCCLRWSSSALGATAGVTGRMLRCSVLATLCPGQPPAGFSPWWKRGSSSKILSKAPSKPAAR